MNTAPGSAANILAVDGGGTKTALAVVSPRGDVLARAAGGGINPFDQPRWAEILRDLIGQLSAPYGAAGLALPGYGEAAAVTAEQDAFAAGLGVPTQVLNDVDAAQQGAFAGNRLAHDDVKGREPVACHHQDAVVADRVVVAHLAARQQRQRCKGEGVQGRGAGLGGHGRQVGNHARPRQRRRGVHAGWPEGDLF